MGVALYQVDAFADAAFTGNPAAVCVLEREAASHWMQQVAAEMNLSETAFVHRLATGGSKSAGASAWSLRWFTPAAEVELCGHATLASAHVLWETGGAPRSQPLCFQTRHRGVLTCQQRDDGAIAMDFPADPATPAEPPGDLLRLLGVASARAAGRSRYDWLVELESEQAVRALQPDFVALARFEVRGVMVTAAAEPGGCYDFVSRFFAPRLRIAEDPVTGSAHCVLAPWWAGRLGRSELVGYQASQRGGTVRTTHRGDRVELAGTAVTVFSGEMLTLPPPG